MLAAERTPIDSFAAYEAAIGQILGLAQREVLVFDRNLARCGFASAEREEMLAGFFHAGRSNRLVIVVQDATYVSANGARLQRLLRRFSESLEIRALRTEAVGEVLAPFVVVDRQHYVRRFADAYARGEIGIVQPATAIPLADRFAELVDISDICLSATTLGL